MGGQEHAHLSGGGVSAGERALGDLVARAKGGHRITRAEVDALVAHGLALDAIFMAFAAAADGNASRSMHHALALLRSFTAPKP